MNLDLLRNIFWNFYKVGFHIKVDVDPVDNKISCCGLDNFMMIYCQHASPHNLLYYLTINCHSAFLLSLQLSGKILRGEFYKGTSPKLKKFHEKVGHDCQKPYFFSKGIKLIKTRVSRFIKIHENIKNQEAYHRKILPFHLTVSKI